MIWNNSKRQRESECRPCSRTHHVEEKFKKRGVGWGGVWGRMGRDIEERLAWRNKTPFSPHPAPTHPLTLPCDKLSQQVLHSAGQPGEMTAQLSDANQSRDAADYCCSLHLPHGPNVSQSSAPSRGPPRRRVPSRARSSYSAARLRDMSQAECCVVINS